MSGSPLVNKIKGKVMTESLATQRIQTLAEAKLRIRTEYDLLKRINKSDKITEKLYQYVFQDGENPYKDLIKERDVKLENVEEQIQEVLQNVRVIK